MFTSNWRHSRYLQNFFRYVKISGDILGFLESEHRFWRCVWSPPAAVPRWTSPLKAGQLCWRRGRQDLNWGVPWCTRSHDAMATPKLDGWSWKIYNIKVTYQSKMDENGSPILGNLQLWITVDICQGVQPWNRPCFGCRSSSTWFFWPAA